MRKKNVVIIAGVAVVLIGGGLCFIGRMLDLGGRGYDPADNRDLQTISGFADDSRPFRLALESYRRDHGHYPAAVEDIFPTYLRHSTNRPDDFTLWKGWDCSEISSNRYVLEYNVNFDSALYYEHEVNGTDQWQYASYATGYDLTLEFTGK